MNIGIEEVILLDLSGVYSYVHHVEILLLSTFKFTGIGFALSTNSNYKMALVLPKNNSSTIA